MCGRYASSADSRAIIEAFDVELDATGEADAGVLGGRQEPAPGRADHNLAPTKQARVVLERAPRGAQDGDDTPADPVRQLRLLTWGLLPPWSTDVRAGVRMINARAESVLTKPAFRAAIRSRRCLVPADGWFEWQKDPDPAWGIPKGRKLPHLITRRDDVPMAMAGIYEFWRDEAVADAADPAAWISTFSIVTTAAEPELAPIHDRQPVVLDPDRWDTWLDPAVTGTADVEALLAGNEVGRFVATPVGDAVGRVQSNGPGLLVPREGPNPA